MSEQKTCRGWSVLDQLLTMSNFYCAQEKKTSCLRDSNVLQNTLKVFILKCFSFNLMTLRCFWLLFHGNVDHPDFRNTPHWFLPDPSSAPIVFVFCTNSRSKEASWAFEEQPRQPFKTILSVHAALILVASVSTISKNGTTMLPVMLSLSLEKNLLLLSRCQSSACYRPSTSTASHSCLNPYTVCNTSFMFLFWAKTTFTVELILWLFI